MVDLEWVQIPGFKNYEVNKNGEVRDQNKVVRPFGQTLFLYGGAGNPMRRAMHKIMRETFGDESVDNSNALVRNDGFSKSK